MKLSAGLSPTPIVRSLGGRVAGGRRPSGSARPWAPLVVSPSPRRPSGTVVTPASPPTVPATWGGVAPKIPIAARAEVGVPSN
jgi:hypothetical protein